MKFYGLVVNDSLVVRPYAPPPHAPLAGAGGDDGGPNFKRFRKMPLLPSSNCYGHLVEFAEACGAKLSTKYVEETQKRMQARRHHAAQPAEAASHLAFACLAALCCAAAPAPAEPQRPPLFMFS